MAKWFDPDNYKYDHQSEFQVEAQINRHLVYLDKNGEGLLCRRSENRYAPDLDIYGFNYCTLSCGHLALYVEVEVKINNDFSEYPDMPKSWFCWSFLGRKVDNTSHPFGNDDVYLLCNDYPHEKCFWTTFGMIRNHSEKHVRQPKNRNEVYYRIPKDSKYIIRGYEKLAQYLIRFAKFNKETAYRQCPPK